MLVQPIRPILFIGKTTLKHTTIGLFYTLILSSSELCN